MTIRRLGLRSRWQRRRRLLSGRGAACCWQRRRSAAVRLSRMLLLRSSRGFLRRCRSRLQRRGHYEVMRCNMGQAVVAHDRWCRGATVVRLQSQIICPWLLVSFAVTERRHWTARWHRTGFAMGLLVGRRLHGNAARNPGRWLLNCRRRADGCILRAGVRRWPVRGREGCLRLRVLFQLHSMDCVCIRAGGSCQCWC